MDPPSENPNIAACLLSASSMTALMSSIIFFQRGDSRRTIRQPSATFVEPDQAAERAETFNALG